MRWECCWIGRPWLPRWLRKPGLDGPLRDIVSSPTGTGEAVPIG
jgi:hypothetical protein